MNTETLISAPKSSSKWLHRLRSIKGFPDSDDTDLPHFLTTLPQPPTPQPQPHHTGKHVHTQPTNNQHHDSISNILSQLFHIGDDPFQHPPPKKTSRKQHSPRICLVSSNSNAAVSSPLNVSRNKVKEVKIPEKEDDHDDDWDVSGYSQTEITVIDTSVASWKFDKVLYRRKNVWKLGNKNGRSGDRKKRKECVTENGDVRNKKFKSRDAQQVDDKKKKKKKKKLKLCNSLKYVDKQDDIIRSKSTQGQEQCKTMVAAYEKKQDNCRQVQEKSFLKKQIDGGSSVILIKSIPSTNKKVVSGISKSCVKSMQK